MQQYYDIIIIGTGAGGRTITYDLLLRSASENYLQRLAFFAALVGRNLVKRNTTNLYAIPAVKKETFFHKTLVINDFYFGSIGYVKPLRHKWAIMRESFLLWAPNSLLKVFANLYVNWSMQSEDLPNVENRVEIAKNKQIKVYYLSNNQKVHRRLRYQFEKILRNARFPRTFGILMPLKILNYQGGACRLGSDSTLNVLNVKCRSHDIDSLYVVDSSFFPSIGAMNPTLTIIANALRVAEHLKQRLNVNLDSRALV
ncbi:GMC oxidoreductase [Rivularia sp. PCC 7116]|uniref:GMC oxidoreductase n=1 Tax=Rivularia sp. PCC 7116 TaxID=373994 RepID=UPI00030EDB03|nr:GMC oxidoreductase [Rivularia sp. PCC 7116]